MSPDNRYLYYNQNNYYTDGISFYRVDLTDMSREQICRADGNPYDVSFELYTSPRKKVLYFIVFDENGRETGGVNAQRGFFNTVTQTSFVIKGEVLRFVDEDNIVVLRTAGGIKLYDTATGEETADAAARLENHEQYYISTAGKQKLTGEYVHTIKLIPYLDSAKKSLTVAENVSAYYIAEDYVYTYTDGDDALCVYSLVNFESFRIKITERFLEEIQYVKKTYALDYRLDVNMDKTRVLLYYYTRDSVVIQYLDLLAGAFAPADSLADLEEIINAAYYDPREYNRLDMRMLKGDGFNVLAILRSVDYYAIVEDYRDGTFTFYDLGIQYPVGVNYSYGIFDVSRRGSWEPNYDKYRKKLDPDAESQKTLETFGYIPVKTALVDYAAFYTDGRVDQEKVWRYFTSVEFIRQNIASADIEKQRKYQGIARGGRAYEIILELVEIATAQDLKQYTETEISKLFFSPQGDECIISGHTYNTIFREDGEYFFVFGMGTTSAGKRYVRLNRRYAFIDEKTYNSLTELCAFWKDSY